jgi:hypothetical protein
MPTTFKNSTYSSIGNEPHDVLTIPPGFRATVIGCNLANITDYETINVDVYVTGSDSVPAYYVKGLSIPPNTAVKIITNGEKLILPENCGLRIASDQADSLSAVISYVEIS